MGKNVIGNISLLFFCFSLFSCARYGHQALSDSQHVEVLPQYKSEVSAIYAECLSQEHGVMLQCIKKRVLNMGEDVDVLVEYNEPHQNWQAPEEFAQRVNAFSPSPENLTRGKEAYQAYCAMCHGDDARGKQLDTFGKRSPDLTAASLMQKTDGEIFWKITEGGWPMPAFWEGDVLNEQDLWLMIGFLRDLSEKNKDFK